MLILGASQIGISISLDDLSLPMLMDVIEYHSRLMGGDNVDNTERKSLSEIAKGGKI